MSVNILSSGWNTGKISTGLALVAFVCSINVPTNSLHTTTAIPINSGTHDWGYEGAASYVPNYVKEEGIPSPIENLIYIRETIKLAISDLAAAFNVSRQSIYNWMNGEPVATVNACKLQDLAKAMQILVSEGISVNSILLKKRIINNQTIMQIVQSGGSASDAANLLVSIYKREAIQRERMRAKFVNRVSSSATADFDLPSSDDI